MALQEERLQIQKKTSTKWVKRIGNIVLKTETIEEQQVSFESYNTTFLFWIKEKTIQMQKRDFSNTLEGIQLDFKMFKHYRIVEKPPKYKDRSNLLRYPDQASIAQAGSLCPSRGSETT